MKCEGCNGRGHFLMPFSTPQCDACGGTGEAKASKIPEKTFAESRAAGIESGLSCSVTSFYDLARRWVADKIRLLGVPVSRVLAESDVYLNGQAYLRDLPGIKDVEHHLERGGTLDELDRDPTIALEVGPGLLPSESVIESWTDRITPYQVDVRKAIEAKRAAEDERESKPAPTDHYLGSRDASWYITSDVQPAKLVQILEKLLPGVPAVAALSALVQRQERQIAAEDARKDSSQSEPDLRRRARQQNALASRRSSSLAGTLASRDGRDAAKNLGLADVVDLFTLDPASSWRDVATFLVDATKHGRGHSVESLLELWGAS